MVRRESFYTGFSLALGAALLALLAFLGWHLFQAVLAIISPFLAAIFIALLLDPLVIRIQHSLPKNQRGPAVLIVFVGFLLCFLGLISFIVPTLIEQTTRLVTFFTPVTYRIDRTAVGNNVWMKVAEDLTASTYTVDELDNNQEYTFRVVIKASTGETIELGRQTATPRVGMGDRMERVEEIAQATPAPPPQMPSPTLPEPSPTPTATPVPSPPGKTGQNIPTPENLKPGEVVAIPGDHQVLLIWRSPREMRSGFERLREEIDAWLKSHRSLGPVSLPDNLDSIQRQYSTQITRALQQVTSRLAELLAGSVSTLLTVILVPILTFYVLADMPRLRGRFLYLMNDRFRRHFLRVAEDVGGAFSNYLRGMFILSVLYGVIATVVYFLCGLKTYALLLGFIAGLFFAVPFVGPAITLVVVVAVSIAAGLSFGQTALVVGLNYVQNFIFDNGVTPRVLGHSVGVHPLLTVFALFLGGQLFGLLGMIFAVPLAAGIQASLSRIFPRLSEPVPLSVLLPEEREAAQNPEVIAPLPEGAPATPTGSEVAPQRSEHLSE